MGGSVQFTCSIYLNTGPPVNNLHLGRLSGQFGATCGVCDQALMPAYPHEHISHCSTDTEAVYKIQCKWNPSSTVMTFIVSGVTAMEITDWTCVSRGDPGMIHSVTIRELGQL